MLKVSQLLHQQSGQVYSNSDLILKSVVIRVLYYFLLTVSFEFIRVLDSVGNADIFDLPLFIVPSFYEKIPCFHAIKAALPSRTFHNLLVRVHIIVMLFPIMVDQEVVEVEPAIIYHIRVSIERKLYFFIITRESR